MRRARKASLSENIKYISNAGTQQQAQPFGYSIFAAAAAAASIPFWFGRISAILRYWESRATEQCTSTTYKS